MAEHARPPASSTATAEGSQSSPPPRDNHYANNTSVPRVRRRNRVIASCLECRRRKLKCDKLAPCTNCTRFRRDCLYLAPALDSASQQKLAEIKNRMGNLEQSLERDVVRRTTSDSATDHIKIEEISDDDDDDDVPEAEDEENLVPTPFAALDQVYDNHDADDLMDLGVRLGKMRLSDRIGGFARPRMAQELDHYSDRNAMRGEAASPSVSDAPRNTQQNSAIRNWLSSQTPDVYLAPGPDYLAPASSFFFSASQVRSSLGDYLPTREICNHLLSHYWNAVHPIATTVHRPSFEKQCASFWEYLANSTEPPASLQAIYFSAIFSAAVSMPEKSVMNSYAIPRITLIERLQTAVETSLSRANFLRTAKLETMQALVMYLIPLCRAELSRSHAALVGTAIRLAECLGLHRDGALYGFSTIETHVRRLVWHQLCFLDVRCVEATGPKPQIRRDDYDTDLPLNVNEQDLTADSVPDESWEQFTDMTTIKLRFECTAMFRQLWFDIPRIDQKKVKLGAVLAKVQKFRGDLERKYMPLLQGNDPRQILAMHVYRLLSGRMAMMLLHRYLDVAGANNPMPERLRKILIEACLSTTEFAVSLDTRTDMAPWAWYRGALIQYHGAMLLVMEIYHYPHCSEAARIWRCLDYVFDFPQDFTGEQKVDSVILGLRERLQVYQSVRKPRTTKTMHEKAELLKDRFPKKNPDLAVLADSTAQGLPDYPGTAPQMTSSEVGMPPLQSYQSFEFDASRNSGFGAVDLTTPKGDAQMQMTDDIDWNEWDRYFPVEDAQGGFGNVDLPDFNMGAFNPYPAQHAWSHTR